MLADLIGGILTRDLKTLRRELEAYPDERDLWKAPPGISNSAGNLALHLVGNLRTFVGATLGGTGYVRDRDAEFSSRDVARSELLRLVDEAMTAVTQTMPKLTDADLAKPFPMPIAGHTIDTGDFLLHLSAHLAYHLGQLDYHRRTVTGVAGAIGAVLPTELRTARKAG
jgi:uncharacterized damage-inducible protein DinB